MSNVNDILSSIYTGRFVAERARADHLARALSEVEEMVREMRPTPEPVTIESGNTADLADLEAMRGTLDGAGYSPTPTGLRGLLDLVERLDQRCEEANELDRRHAEALATISDLRAQVAALTPGPWTRLGDMAPDSGETVLMRTGVVGLPWMQFVSEDTVQHLPADYLWRRFPAGLLDVPAPTVAP